ncbi:MAG: hypothetical protein GY847_10760 [Proteobacteria bacterium]|nr:hypothetical protein [Pseudomonadota bacterium]
MNKDDYTDSQPKHDLIVLSDLHLGEGLLRSEPRYAPTEDFFCDRQFEHFLKCLDEKYRDDPSRLVLVLNGDIFDFLTVVRVPSPDEARDRGFTVTAAEQKFGLNPTSEKSVYKIDIIAAGHPIFFGALARFIAAGYRVNIIRGNHDLELHFTAVRERILDHLTRFEDGPDMSKAREQVRFHEWFYLEPGRVYIEHGNQYDSTNSIRYPLRPLLPEKKWWKTKEEEALDYPLGSIFVRFFYNRVRRLDPYTPRLLSFEQYLDFIRRYNLFDIWRVYKDHYPHFVTAIGSTTTSGSSRSSEKEDVLQEGAFDKLADSDEHGSLYRQLNEMKIHPVSASKPAVVAEMITPMIRRALWLSLFTFAALFIWFGILQLIDKVPWITANAFLMSLFAVMTLGGALWAWIHLQRKLRRRSQDAAVEIFVERAEKITGLTGVRMVLMGHTHLVDYRRLNNGKAVYANSGTWTSVDNPWNRIMRDARRLTFLHVKGGDVELCRWNDDAGRVDTVPLFYLGEENIPDHMPIDSLFNMRTNMEHSWLPSASIGNEEEEYRSSSPPPPITG